MWVANTEDWASFEMLPASAELAAGAEFRADEMLHRFFDGRSRARELSAHGIYLGIVL